MTDSQQNESPSIHIDPARIISEVDPRIYGGFTEHMGRCIYGGIYDPGNSNGLADPETGFRTDVMSVIRELQVPLVRYPGGNFVCTYRWQDGVGPKELRPRRPDLAWLTEESNQFGTDEFITWCKAVGTEPFLCLNMGTGTLEDALAWVEYCNLNGNTHYANMRRKNGFDKPHGVKYWALGNEIWGPWQVGQQTAAEYASKAFQWAKALRLLDPSIKLISCGENGHSDWDRVTLRTLAPVVDFHSLHTYTLSQGKHIVNVMGPAAAEKGIDITRSLIDLAKIENNLSKDLTICFDEWNVWDPVRAPGEKGAEEHYDLSDALAVAAWLNVFVRKADIVKIACIAQSINVISPIITSPEGLFKQTTFYPLHLFSTLMRGLSLDVHVTTPSPMKNIYNGPTVPKFIADLATYTPDRAKNTKFVDVSAVLATTSLRNQEIRIAILNKHEDEEFSVPLRFGPDINVGGEVTVHEVWHADLKATNGFDGEHVQTVTSKIQWEGAYRMKKHSFQVLVFEVIN